MRGNKWTAQDTDDLIELHKEGSTAGQIAKVMGRSPSTVCKHAAMEGLTFLPDKRTVKTIKTNRVRGLEKRTDLAARLWEKGHELMDQLDQPHIHFKIGGKDNTYTEHAMDKPDVDATYTILRSVAVIVDKAAKIEEIQNANKDMSDIDLFISHLLGDDTDGTGDTAAGTGSDTESVQSAKDPEWSN